MLAVANILFFIFHTVLILFNVFGWMWKRTRPYNLITLSMTLFSWCVMGLRYGMGYCICTDWHFRIRHAMGIQETSDNYLVLLVRNISGWDPPLDLVKNVAATVFIVSILASVTLNLRDRRVSEPQHGQGQRQ